MAGRGAQAEHDVRQAGGDEIQDHPAVGGRVVVGDGVPHGAGDLFRVPADGRAVGVQDLAAPGDVLDGVVPGAGDVPDVGMPGHQAQRAGSPAADEQRRARSLDGQLTAAGRDCLRAAERAREELERDFLAPLSDADAEGLVRALRTLVVSPKAAGWPPVVCGVPVTSIDVPGASVDAGSVIADGPHTR